MVPEHDMHDLKSLSRAAKGGTLELERLAVKAYEMGSEACHRACLPTPLSPTDTLNLDELEQIAVREALNRTHNAVAAAALLGIGKTTLYRKLRQYHISFIANVVHCPNCGRPVPTTTPHAA